ncbi:hypothetical protein KR009_007084 [Drosophila setifemur]|nr:hypothetical protein KR009_007084 [Drosophila setifemur]
MEASKVSAVILRGMFNFARLIGMNCFSLSKSNSGIMVMKEAPIRSSGWKWIFVICHLVILVLYICGYAFWIMERDEFISYFLQWKHLLLAVPCYMWAVLVQHFRANQVIRLFNRYMRLWRRVRAMTKRKKTGFGGGRELILIVFWLACQGHEVYFIFGKFQCTNWKCVMGWFCYTYVLFASHMMMRINFVWYLSVGVLCSEINGYVATEMSNLKYPQRYRLRKSLPIYRELSSIATTFQDMFNEYLFFSLMQTFFYITVFSYEMIYFMTLHDYIMWSLLVKILLDLLHVSLAVQGAVDSFKGIRELHFEMSGFGESEEWQRNADIFLCFLNQNKFEVRLFGLFDISLERFLITASGIITYLIFIIQCVYQFNSLETVANY